MTLEVQKQHTSPLIWEGTATWIDRKSRVETVLRQVVEKLMVWCSGWRLVLIGSGPGNIYSITQCFSNKPLRPVWLTAGLTDLNWYIRLSIKTLKLSIHQRQQNTQRLIDVFMQNITVTTHIWTATFWLRGTNCSHKREKERQNKLFNWQLGWISQNWVYFIPKLIYIYIFCLK